MHAPRAFILIIVAAYITGIFRPCQLSLGQRRELLPPL